LFAAWVFCLAWLPESLPSPFLGGGTADGSLLAM